MIFKHLLELSIMKKLTLLVLVVVCVLGAVGQSPRSKNEMPVTPAVRITETAKAATATTKNSAYTAAALSNVSLRNELTWTFGGKQQHGWYLYELLINKTLDSKHDASSDNFAATLAKWQKQRGLDADGVLNENSLMAFVSQWQSDRL
jgi:hypothetical protein